MVPNVALLLLFALILSPGCSGDRKAPAPPAPAPSSAAGGITAPSVQPGEGGSPAAGASDRVRGAADRNTLPVVRAVRFVHADLKAESGLAVEVEGYDADGDAVQFEIVWSRNGEPAGVGRSLTPALKRGDKVAVTVTPFDGKEKGNPSTHYRDIANTGPVIEGQERFQVGDNEVTFHVRASDADGDPLTYSLKDAPAGMSIDRKTGWVRWATSPGTAGKVPFLVVVSDGAGAETTARFTVTVAEQPSPGAR